LNQKAEQIALNLFSSGIEKKKQKKKTILWMDLILKIREGLNHNGIGDLLGVDRR
jgi:hypothetical protein